MSSKLTAREIIYELICFLLILLFVYAALNKLLDFENFQVQLGQSPMLSSFAGWVSYSIPVSEILISLLLCFSRYRRLGLFASLCLMVMFTAYILIILNFSPFVPCSCGGIIEKLTWDQHLIFNIVFVLLAVAGIVLGPKEVNPTKGPTHTVPHILISSLLSASLMVVLFLLSEDLIHTRNNFIRRFPHHAAMEIHEMDITHRSFYIAGVDGNSIFLGNLTAPLSVLVVDTALHQKRMYRIKLPSTNLQYRAVKIKVESPYFYVYDGTVPCIYKGSISDWKAKLIMQGEVYFNALEPMGNEQFAIRAVSSKTRENILGTLSLKDSARVRLSDSILKKQIDGVFDTDGKLLYNRDLGRILYTYYYRNQYLISSPSLKLLHTGNTIDTTTHAAIKVAYIESRKESKLSAPALSVNRIIATSGNFLFVNSGLVGKYEQEDIWEVASIIDVYNITDRTYAFSFYLYNKGDQKMTDFAVYKDLVFVIIGNYLSTCRIKTGYYSTQVQPNNNAK